MNMPETYLHKLQTDLENLQAALAKTTEESLTNMVKLELKVVELLEGIDETEIESEKGWWETSTGAELGAETLAQIRAAFRNFS